MAGPLRGLRPDPAVTKLEKPDLVWGTTDLPAAELRHTVPYLCIVIPKSQLHRPRPHRTLC